MVHMGGSAGLLDRRLVVVLMATVGVEAAVACWVLAAPRSIPLAGAVPVALLPQVLCGLAVGLAAFIAPLIGSRQEDGVAADWTGVGRAGFVALWQAATLAYFLLVASRLAPLETESILRAALWVALFTFASMLLARVAPRAFAGLIFVWLVALPVFAYLLAEVFLGTPSGSGAGWEQAGAQAQAVRGTVRGLLSFSPGTGAVAVLTGSLPDGSEFSSLPPMAALGLGCCALAAWSVRGGTGNALAGQSAGA